MLHVCDDPINLEKPIDRFKAQSWIYTAASDIPAAHCLPPDQPILTWCESGGGKRNFGDETIRPDLVVLPINNCPFCGRDKQTMEVKARSELPVAG